MSDTNNTVFRAVEETVTGVTPDNPIFRTICHTGIGLATNPVTQASQRICGGSKNRAPEAPRLLGQAPSGPLSFEYIHDLHYIMPGLVQRSWTEQDSLTNLGASAVVTNYAANVFTVTAGGTDFPMDSLIRVAGCGDPDQEGVYQVTASTGTTITIAGGPDSFGSLTDIEIRYVGVQVAPGDFETTTTGGNALISTGLDFTTLTLAVGDWIKIGGNAPVNQFASFLVNGFCRVSQITAARLDFDRVPIGFVADAGIGQEIRIFLGDSIRDGRDKRSYTLQAEYIADDSSSIFEVFPGSFPGSLSLSGENRENAQIITGSVGFLGVGEVLLPPVQFTGAREIPGYLTEPFNSGGDVARISEGGVISTDAGDAVVNLTLNIENNDSRLGAWGSNTGSSIRSGDLAISGIIETYFNDTIRLNKSVNQTPTSIDTVLLDSVHNYATVIDMPSVRISGDPPAQGRNAVHTVPFNYTAHPDDELDYTIKFMRFWAYTDA